MFLYIFVVVCAVFVILYVASLLYFKKGLFKSWFHNVLEWHIPSNEISFDGTSFESRCKYCKKHILQDSQGNWFTL